jgi:alpha,alpha-trehalase
MLENFLYDLLQPLGLVPNGNRVYYTQRTQPPMLTPMVWKYVQVTGDMDLQAAALPLLDLEYAFWMANRSVTVSCACVSVCACVWLRVCVCVCVCVCVWL